MKKWEGMELPEHHTLVAVLFTDTGKVKLLPFDNIAMVPPIGYKVTRIGDDAGPWEMEPISEDRT